MTSSRLPGKVLKEAGGKPLLQILIERLKKVEQLNEICVATTINETDEPIVELIRKLNISCFRGSEEDVLSRVLGAAKMCHADIIVEITGDCPLIDPEIVSQVIDLYLHNECDYASNCEPITYPIGMDVQVFSVELLAMADKEGNLPEDREHVSWFIRRQPERFNHLTLFAPPALKYPDLSITLDEKEDYELIKCLYESLSKNNEFFTCYDMVNLLKSNEKLASLNKHIIRKEVIRN